MIVNTNGSNTTITIPDNNTTYSNATTSTAGLMSSSDKTKLDGIATGATKVTVDSALSSTSTNPVQNKVVNTAISNLNTLVGDTAVSTQITNAIDEITPASIGAATSSHTHSGYASTSHTHNYAGSSSAGGAANSVANSMTVQLNSGTTEGTNKFTFNGSAAKSVNITPSTIGAAASSHTHSASNVTAGTLGGSVVANASAVSTLTTKQVRNTTISTTDPTSSDGGNGDIWITYGSAQSDCPFPVGGVYISIASTDPSSIWAGTTWEQFAKGRTLVGLDTSDSNFNTIGQTGGKKTHTLTPDELPAHGHGMAHTHSYTGPNTGSWKVGTGKAHTWCTSAGGKTSGGASKTTTDNAGGGLEHNNLQPYIVVYMWKRVS